MERILIRRKNIKILARKGEKEDKDKEDRQKDRRKKIGAKGNRLCLM